MIYSITNGVLSVSIKEYGCELTSIKNTKTQKEYLWQGDESIWYGQSPILFPIVGRLIDDEYRLNGKTYTMPKHGFARKTEWKLKEKNSSDITFCLTENEDTLKLYPYSFELSVKFVLNDNKLSVTHTVKNNSNQNMYFSLGAHPGFNCKNGDTLSFSEKETLSTEKIDLVKSLRLPETVPVLNNETDITITKSIFDEDALILHGIKSEYITLNCKESGHKIKFKLNNAPYLGIWAKPGAPYVCIEPWWGVNDSTVKKDDISKKDAINCLIPDQNFVYTWEAEIID